MITADHGPGRCHTGHIKMIVVQKVSRFAARHKPKNLWHNNWSLDSMTVHVQLVILSS